MKSTEETNNINTKSTKGDNSMAKITHRFQVDTAIATHTDEGDRYATNGINVSPTKTPGKVSLQATDARRAVMVLTDGYAHESVTIDAKVLKIGSKPIDAELENGRLRTTPVVRKGQIAPTTEITNAVVGGRFPRLVDVFPSIDLSEYTITTLNSEFLSQISAALRPKGADKEQTGITLYVPTAPSKPVVFRFGNNLGIIMPFQSSESNSELTAKHIAEYNAALAAHGFRD